MNLQDPSGQPIPREGYVSVEGATLYYREVGQGRLDSLCGNHTMGQWQIGLRHSHLPAIACQGIGCSIRP
jgi:hypothetical protein